MMIEELAFVALAGERVPSRAVLVDAWAGWQVELEDVPEDSCPFVERECAVAFDTWDGRHYEGTVSASYSSTEASYLILIGQGSLSCVLMQEP